MRYILVLSLLLLAPLPAHAQQAEAREAARTGNCTPGKVEPVKRVTGRQATTVFKIACTGQKDVFVLVRCQDRTCTLLR
ncbi:hypothetical protein HHL28_06160 [Aerophototrophica crusticola]|uniref:Uncharacterized protein n=1 Tax=Aerophototrophica crusticola TaxID=1709002 RepID=A0A858R5N0_9PROT|nr:hypothetical protein HHL28_06160 [Rhodospirillaceae bacterium B3]